jgi:hypothetical protein
MDAQLLKRDRRQTRLGRKMSRFAHLLDVEMRHVSMLNARTTMRERNWLCFRNGRDDG